MVGRGPFYHSVRGAAAEDREIATKKRRGIDARPSIRNNRDCVASKTLMFRTIPRSMMRSRTGKHLTFACVALYAGATLFGQALHALPGCAHHHEGLSQSPSQPRQCSLFEPGGSDAPACAAADDLDSCDDCPICRFHSQGQLSVAALTVGPCLRMQDEVSAPSRSVLATDRPGIYRSRAPPRV